MITYSLHIVYSTILKKEYLILFENGSTFFFRNIVIYFEYQKLDIVQKLDIAQKLDIVQKSRMIYHYHKFPCFKTCVYKHLDIPNSWRLICFTKCEGSVHLFANQLYCQ
jgi:hypothetical protein